MVVGPPLPGGVTQGRRFNGRPAVSKTASGGSNPSAPANPIDRLTERRVWKRGSMEGSGNFLESVTSWPTRTRDYFNELKLEMKRVTWPNRKQVEGTTLVVIF